MQHRNHRPRPHIWTWRPGAGPGGGSVILTPPVLLREGGWTSPGDRSASLHPPLLREGLPAAARCPLFRRCALSVSAGGPFPWDSGSQGLTHCGLWGVCRRQGCSSGRLGKGGCCSPFWSSQPWADPGARLLGERGGRNRGRVTHWLLHLP